MIGDACFQGGSPDGEDEAPYPAEFRREAVRLLRSGERSTGQLARELACSSQSLRNWVRQDEAHRGERPGSRDVVSHRIDGDSIYAAGGKVWTPPTGRARLELVAARSALSPALPACTGHG
jgi:transposase-like protein